MIIAQNGSEHKEVDYGEHDVDGTPHEESFDAVMVTDALHDVPCHLRVEIVQGQLHQFHEEVRNQRDVDTAMDMQ